MPTRTRPDAYGRTDRKRKTKTFRPNYISFSGTYQCNLTCAHCCVPIEWPDRLDIAVAERFLVAAHAEGVATIGFTGGEPFLYLDFVLALTRKAAALGMRFDKVQTNGVWFDDEAHLTHALEALQIAGFTGKLGLSVDKFHGKHTAQAALFCRVSRRVFGRDNMVSLSYASRAPDQGLDPVRDLARELDGVIDWSDVLHRFMLVSDELTIVLNWNHLAPVERAERFTGAWDGTWFAEDYCEGPGQALIVTPKGEVKPCCGFASDLDQLTIGNIYTDTPKEVIRNGREHPYVGKLFREGLTAFRDEILEQNPSALPGATSNHCYFCWYILIKELVTLPAGSPGTSPARTSLPMAGEAHPLAVRPGEMATALLMAFDGKTVFLGRELSPQMPLEKGRVYLVNITGPTSVEAPEQMTWTDYQSWIDRLRGEGHTLTTHHFSPCQK